MQKDPRFVIVQLLAGETPKAAEDFNRNYGIVGAKTLLSLDCRLFRYEWGIGINSHAAVLDRNGVIRARCSSMDHYPDYCGKGKDVRCQGHDKDMWLIVKDLLKKMPKPRRPKKARKPKAGPKTVSVAGGWSKANRISEGGFNESPCLAIDRKGNVIAAWTRGHRGHGDVMWSVFKGTSWSPPASLAAYPKADEFDPRLALDGGGRIHAVYVSNATGPYDIHHAVFTGKGWSKSMNVTEGKVRTSVKGVPMNSMAPDVCAMKDGGLALVFYTWGECRMGRRSPFKKEQWPWPDPIPPRVRDRDLYAAFLEKGKFTRPELVSDRDYDGAQDHTDPAIARHPEGGAFIAWSCDHPECFMNEFRGSKIFGHTLGRRIEETGSDDIVPVSPVGATRSRYPEVNVDLACSALNDLWAVWDSTSTRGKPSHRIVASKWGKDGWTEPKTITEGENVIAPRVYALGTKMLVLWESLTERGVKLCAARIDGGKGGILTSGRQPFATFRAGKAWLAFASRSKDSWDIYVCSQEGK
ncbi:MAG: hypothetical protein ACYS47_03800 [Planctomycetota bacterium]|jgi:hypothetical protein